jgi:hypothetical protein
LKLVNPTFIKGSKSYMLIDKSACNKPLTLDCQVNSNPASNITWYRKRLSRSYIKRLNKYTDYKLNSFTIQSSNNNYYSLFGGKSYGGLNIENFNDLNNMYENEMIGTGPTYTIASFNCANVLNNLKNKTKSSVRKSSENLLNRFKRENENQNMNDYMNDSFLDIDEYDYDSEESLNENEEQVYDYMSQNNDFGVYMCEATNKLRQSENLYFNNLKNVAASRRFIKLNPNGAPILGIVPSVSSNSVANDQMMSLATHPNFDQQLSIAELPVTIGASISLTCLIEPLPSFQKIEWLRENGKIIPDSKYLASKYAETENKYEINNKNENLFTNEETTSDATFTGAFNSKNKNARSLKNFKTKYESTDEENMSNSNNELGSSNLEIISTTNYLVSSSGIFPTSESTSPMRSVLNIKNVRKQDLGIYKCKSTNSYGNRLAVVILRERTFIGKKNHLAKIFFEIFF